MWLVMIEMQILKWPQYTSLVRTVWIPNRVLEFYDCSNWTDVVS